MLKYAKIENEGTKQVSVGLGTNTEFYKSIGMVEMDVEQAYDGDWYVTGYAPEKPAPTKEEVSETRRQLYIAQVDPITAHINRLKDEEAMTAEINAQIEALKAERAEVVAKIKEENPYPAE
jgi:YbbR domain-containing protein